MSSSISLGTSVDLESLTSNSFTESDKDVALFNDDVKNNPKNSLHDNKEANNHKSRSSNSKFKITRPQTNLEGSELVDFYEEVDERMSRNSVEYPEQQAKFVGRWLNDMDLSRPLSLDSQAPTNDQNGNIVGIRGFPKGDAGRKQVANKGIVTDDQRSSFNKLKFNYSKLQTDYDQLQTQSIDTMGKFKRLLKRRDHDIDLLKGFMERRDTGGRKSATEAELRCCCAASKCCRLQHHHHHHQLQSSSQAAACGNEVVQQDELKRLRHEHGLLELRLGPLDRQHDERIRELLEENNRLRNETTRIKSERNEELIRMRQQVEALSLEPDNKMLISLRQENSRLRNLNEMGKAEMKLLQENYQQLELNLKALIDEHKHLAGDKDEEISKVMVELCRLQVYQPKLEATLDTERAIKLELQNRLEALTGEKDHLKVQLDDLNRELNRERMRSRGNDSIELEALQKELEHWQGKYHRLRKEKADVDEMLRASRLKLSSLEARHRAETDLVNEANRCEVGKLLERNMKSEERCNGLKTKLGELEMKLNEYSVENNKLNQVVMELNKKLAIAKSSSESPQNLLKRLKDCEELGASLGKQLEVSELKSREMLDDYERIKGQLYRSKQQVEQFRGRFKLQQKALDEMKASRDKELAKLRVSLNFERYNRQVALKGIEKELRCSLRELEAMKCRFSRRLVAQNDTSTSSSIHGRAGKTTTTTTTTATSTNRAPKSNGSN